MEEYFEQITENNVTKNNEQITKQNSEQFHANVL